MLLVTGGAGFIGSNVVASLNQAGRHDVAISDWLGSEGKWRNLHKRQLADVVAPGDLSAWLEGRFKIQHAQRYRSSRSRNPVT